MSVFLEQMGSITEMWCRRSWEGLVDRRASAFARAQILKSATGRDAPQVAREFLDFFETTGASLFRDEEEWVLRSLHPAPPAVVRALEEHNSIASMVDALIQEAQAGCVDVRVLNGLGELLAAHLLSEEEDVRPLLSPSRLVVAP